MCSIFTSSVQASNECVNSVIFVGSTLQSNYWPETFIQDINKNSVQLIYLPTAEHRHRQLMNGYLCAYNDIPDHIPALVLWRPTKASTCILYFHGNAADISHTYKMAIRQSVIYNAHFMAIEYPRYGFANGNPTMNSVNACAHIAYDFLVDRLEVPSSKIIIMGNSIGTGPACYLASYLEANGTPPLALILHAPYAAITEVARDVLQCLPSCFLNRWTNYKALLGEGGPSGTIRCPVMFIHADNDKIIDYEHSYSMHKARLARKLPSFLHTQKSTEEYIAGHNHFNYVFDLETPVGTFIKNLKLADNRDFGIDVSVLNSYARCPDEYIYRLKVNYNKNKKLDVICRWMFCPCVCPAEAMMACTYETILSIHDNYIKDQSAVSGDANTKRSTSITNSSTDSSSSFPPYKYQTKAMRGKPYLTLHYVLWKILKTGSTAGIIEESPQVKEKRGEDKVVINPLTQSANKSTLSKNGQTAKESDALKEVLVSQSNESHPQVTRRRKLSISNVNITIDSAAGSDGSKVVINPLSKQLPAEPSYEPLETISPTNQSHNANSADRKGNERI